MRRIALAAAALVLALSTFTVTEANAAQPSVESFCPSWATVLVCDKSGENCSWMCII